MLKLTQTLLLLFAIQTTLAQVTLTGKVTDDKNTPIEFAVVSLTQGDVMKSTAVTNSTGGFQFAGIAKGNYHLAVKYVAYQDTLLTVSLNRDTVMNIALKTGRILQGVMVRAQKPVFQREIDRLRFNVGETDLAKGSNVWDVLEKTPLVTVSNDGGIQISGTTGAVVYMNNKKKVLSGTALRDYLSSLPSDNLEAVEVITTPSSRYDAEGGAGIINIVTKKNKEEGLIGNAALSGRQTAVNSQAGSIYLNNRQGKWNVYSNVYMSNRSRTPQLQREILYPAGDINDLTRRSINSKTDYQILSPGFNAGADHQINANHVVGVLLDYSGTWHKETRDAFSHDYSSAGEALTSTNNKDDRNSQTYSLNLNYQGKLDATGTILSVDLDALEYRSANNSVSKTDALNLLNNEPLLVKDWFRSASPQQIGNRSIKADLDWPASKTVTLSTGIKSSFSKIDNDLLFENHAAGDTWVRDNSRSNLFKYDENIHSVYALLNHKVSKQWAYQVGVRVENTLAKGWLDGEKVVDRNYVNVFPTAFLKYTTAKKQAYVLAVTSRITRPGYGDVNPFRTYTTNQTYFTGNPFLLPSKYYRQELSHTINSKAGTISLQLAANQTIGEIFSLPYADGSIIVNQKVNYGNKYSYSGAATYYNALQPWWKFSGTVLAGYVVTRGSYASNVAVDNQTFVLTVTTNQSFTLSKKLGLYGTVIANNTIPVTIVNTHIGNRLETELRVRKTIGAFSVTASAQDLFKSNQDRYNIRLGDLRIRDRYYNDTRSVALALTYNFGKQTVKDKRDRDTGAQEVKQRLG